MSTPCCDLRIPYILSTKMAGKCILMSCCVVLMVITIIVYVLLSVNGFSFLGICSKIDRNTSPTLTVFHRTGEEYTAECTCDISDISEVEASSLESFARSLAKVDDPEFRLNALAVYSNLTSACERLHHVNKVRLEVHKIALVTLVNKTACSLRYLAMSAQNAGYSMLIYNSSNVADVTFGSKATVGGKLLIPVMNATKSWSCWKVKADVHKPEVLNDHFLAADQKDVLIRAHISPQIQTQDELTLTKIRAACLYCIFVGPAITLLWLIGSKKLCCMPDGIVAEDQAVRTGIRTVEEGENRNEESCHSSVVGETTGNGGDEERQPLLIPITNNLTTQTLGIRCVQIIKKIPYKMFLGGYYLIIMITALPVGISWEGASFFRFDPADDILTSIVTPTREDHGDVVLATFNGSPFLPLFFAGVSLLWPPIQIFCFLTYSIFHCKATWTVKTNFSKLIRSDWLASNIYLLVLGVVVPVCTFSFTIAEQQSRVVYFATYNTVCTTSNFLFILVLNKHKFVTRYVFFASICMICAYIASDIVALFYFAQNSEGSLNDLKLTALRTLGIGYTLIISFSSSMHIIRKLAKPRESLFEGLSEK